LDVPLLIFGILFSMTFFIFRKRLF
jgi:hypothetical protein